MGSLCSPGYSFKKSEAVKENVSNFTSVLCPLTKTKLFFCFPGKTLLLYQLEARRCIIDCEKVAEYVDDGKDFARATAKKEKEKPI